MARSRRMISASESILVPFRTQHITIEICWVRLSFAAGVSSFPFGLAPLFALFPVTVNSAYRSDLELGALGVGQADLPRQLVGGPFEGAFCHLTDQTLEIPRQQP